MNCPLLSENTAEDTMDILLDYTAGRLDAKRTAKLEKHMLSCARCAAFRTEQAGVWAALDLWEPEPVSMSFNRSLWQKIEASASASWYRKLVDALRFGAWKPVFPLAAAVFVVAAGFVFDHQGTGTTTPGVINASGVSMNEVDQVEKTLDDLQLLRQFDAVSAGVTTSQTDSVPM